MIGYHTVYQTSMTVDLLGSILVPLLFTLAGIAMVRGWVDFKDRKRSKYFGYFFIAFSLLIEITAVVDSSTKYVDMKRTLQQGQYQIVEGSVEDFVPMQDYGNKRERFSVNGVFFSYSDFVITQCFNNSSTHGGPIRAHLKVRVSYVDNCSLKLEVADDSGSTSPR
jgi:hypothetical protein